MTDLDLQAAQREAEQGFGVLTEIDLRATLKAKFDVDVAPQLILGACRPVAALAALPAANDVRAPPVVPAGPGPRVL